MSCQIWHEEVCEYVEIRFERHLSCEAVAKLSTYVQDGLFLEFSQASIQHLGILNYYCLLNITMKPRLN